MDPETTVRRSRSSRRRRHKRAVPRKRSSTAARSTSRGERSSLSLHTISTFLQTTTMTKAFIANYSHAEASIQRRHPFGPDRLRPGPCDASIFLRTSPAMLRRRLGTACQAGQLE